MSSSFPWDSKTQEKGYFALVHYLRRLGRPVPEEVDAVAAFFIEKEHQANEWWRDLLGDQLAMRDREIQRLQGELERMSSLLDRVVSRQSMRDLANGK